MPEQKQTKEMPVSSCRLSGYINRQTFGGATDYYNIVAIESQRDKIVIFEGFCIF